MLGTKGSIDGLYAGERMYAGFRFENDPVTHELRSFSRRGMYEL